MLTTSPGNFKFNQIQSLIGGTRTEISKVVKGDFCFLAAILSHGQNLTDRFLRSTPSVQSLKTLTTLSIFGSIMGGLLKWNSYRNRTRFRTVCVCHCVFDVAFPPSGNSFHYHGIFLVGRTGENRTHRGRPCGIVTTRRHVVTEGFQRFAHGARRCSGNACACTRARRVQRPGATNVRRDGSPDILYLELGRRETGLRFANWPASKPPHVHYRRNTRYIKRFSYSLSLFISLLFPFSPR